jgi:aminoglycoside/choline kinase family phosphotransferase
MSREDLARSFIAAAGWSDAKVSPLAGDASNRRYDRLTRYSGETAVLMDSPPEKGEDVRPFIRIAEYLTSLGLSAPHILGQNIDRGFLLIEDLGDRLFAREMAENPPCETTLYEVATAVLAELHRAAPPDLPAYDSKVTVPLAALAYDWYQLGATGAVDEAAKSAFCSALHPVLSPYDDRLSVLVQRDYHAENLLWLPDRAGVARVGLLDFQDAMLGHPCYDVVSILQDARRDVSPQVATDVKAMFIARTGADPEAFEHAYAVFGLQRNLRILGVFARLCMRDGKAHYIDLIPRVWGHVQRNLRHPALQTVAPLLADSLPVPDTDIRNRLKDACGRWAGR